MIDEGAVSDKVVCSGLVVERFAGVYLIARVFPACSDGMTMIISDMVNCGPL